jgi:hypothetical protein
MGRPSMETARQWAPKPVRDRLPGGKRKSGLATRLQGGKSRSKLSERLPGAGGKGGTRLSERLPGGKGGSGLLDAPKAAMRGSRRRGWAGGRRRRTAGGLSGRAAAVRKRAPSMPKPPSVSMPSVSMPSVSMPSIPKRSRKARRRTRRMAGNLGLLVGAGAGYVLGTKAGRERYQQIVDQAKQLWQRPQVQDTVAKGRDRAASGVSKAAATAGDRLSQVRERSERTPEPEPSPNGPSRPATAQAPGPSSPGATGAPE